MNLARVHVNTFRVHCDESLTPFPMDATSTATQAPSRDLPGHAAHGSTATGKELGHLHPG